MKYYFLRRAFYSSFFNPFSIRFLSVSNPFKPIILFLSFLGFQLRFLARSTDDPQRYLKHTCISFIFSPDHSKFLTNPRFPNCPCTYRFPFLREKPNFRPPNIQLISGFMSFTPWFGLHYLFSLIQSCFLISKFLYIFQTCINDVHLHF